MAHLQWEEAVEGPCFSVCPDLSLQKWLEKRSVACEKCSVGSTKIRLGSLLKALCTILDATNTLKRGQLGHISWKEDINNLLKDRWAQKQ